MEFIGLSDVEWLALGFTLGMIALCILLDASNRPQKDKKDVDTWV